MRSLIIMVSVFLFHCGDTTIVNLPIRGAPTVPGGQGQQVPRESHEYGLCGMRLFLTTENGHGTQIQFQNDTAATTITKIFNNRTGALVAQNCVWPRSSDVSNATFEAGDQFRIKVLRARGQILSRLCTEVLNSLFHQFEDCDEAIFNFVAAP